MSQSQTKIRRTPKTPFFLGNLILLFFAIYLVFFGPDPWSMSTVLLVVLCVFTGGILSILPFLLDQWVVANLNRMRALQVGMNLRVALDRSEKVTEKLEEIQREDSPVRLIAERLPELVETKLLEAQAKADSDATRHRGIIRDQLENLTRNAASLEPQQNLLESIAAHYATREYLETGITRIREDLHKISVQVGEVQRIYTSTRPVPVPEKKGTNSADVVEPALSKPDYVKTEKSERTRPYWQRDRTSPTETTATKETPSPKNSSTKTTEKEKTTTKAKESTLTVSSFIGIQNKIYLRGNGPGLNPGKGILLQVTGIGEWQWKGELEQPMKCELWLNDEKSAKEGEITLQPGEKKTVQPSFS